MQRYTLNGLHVFCALNLSLTGITKRAGSHLCCLCWVESLNCTELHFASVKDLVLSVWDERL